MRDLKWSPRAFVYYKRKAKYHIDVLLLCYCSGKVQGVQIVRSVSLGAHLFCNLPSCSETMGFHLSLEAEKKRFSWLSRKKSVKMLSLISSRNLAWSNIHCNGDNIATADSAHMILTGRLPIGPESCWKARVVQIEWFWSFLALVGQRALMLFQCFLKNNNIKRHTLYLQYVKKAQIVVCVCL